MSEEWKFPAQPQVPPDAKFRQDLQRALEQTHRQQLVQRQLGTQPTHHRAAVKRQRWFGMLLLITALLVGLYLLRPAKVT